MKEKRVLATIVRRKLTWRYPGDRDVGRRYH
jgi:hypothetical protein